MSLDDQFLPKDKDLITRLDNIGIRAAYWVGTAYQHLTGKDARELWKRSYEASIISGVASLSGAGIVFAGFSGIHRAYKKPTTPLEERMYQEAHGRPANTMAFTRIGRIGILPALAGLGVYGLSTTTQEVQWKDVAQYAFFVLSPTLNLVAEYFTLAQYPKPPEKTVWKRAKEYVHDSFTPHLDPTPVKSMISTH